MSILLLLTLDDITVALIHNPTCEKYSLFDSHLSDVTGNPISEGAAVLLTFEGLSQYLLRLYPNILFNITQVIFCDANVNRANSPSTDLNSSGTEKRTSAKFVGTDEKTYESKKGGKDKESIQSSTTPDPGHHM